MAYAVETDLEGYMIEAFDGSSDPTTTAITALLASLSDLVDAIDNVTSDFYDSTNAPQRVKMAVVSTASAIIKNQRDPEVRPLTDQDVRATMRQHLAEIKVQTFQVTRDDVST